MESNVLGWAEIQRGQIDLTPYRWETEHIPIGEFVATLDFKVWAKKVTGINCYFTLAGSGEMIKLTVFRIMDSYYRLLENGIDFRDCPTGVAYKIETVLNGKGNVAFKRCELLQ